MNDNSTSSNITSKRLSTNANDIRGRYYSFTNLSKKESEPITDYRYNYEDSSYNHLNKVENTPYTDTSKLIEPFSPQPGVVYESTNKTDKQHDKSDLPVSFDLDKIIQKYGDNTDLLQLILSSKVEEDRRRAEEAKLKQKELDYLVSNKERVKQNSSCQNCNSKKHANSDELSSISNINCCKGKGKDNTNSVFNQEFSTKSMKEDYSTNNNSNCKRKIRDNDDDRQLFFSANRDDDYFSSSSSSSYLSPAQCEKTSHRSKRHSSLNQIYSSSLSDVSPGGLSSSTPNETPTRQLHSLDHLNSNRNTFGPLSPSIYPRKSFTGKFSTGDCVPPNTLPPISSSFISHEQGVLGTYSPFISTQNSSTITSTPLNYRQVGHNHRFQNLPTLDSFESSIMETLPFDNKSENTSSVDENYSNIKSMKLNDNEAMSFKIGNSLIQNANSKEFMTKDKRFLNTTVSPGFPVHESNSTKKLPLPPNTMQKSQSSDLLMRPRRRRREMQAITMIIETREFPYNDDFVWKNNGNTIHKSSGQKSIYYKCSNSNLGCPVNKTVTFRDNGEYLIKYRGGHLDECSKLKRVATT